MLVQLHFSVCPQLLVKKSYGGKRKRHKLRNWQLQQLDREMEATNQESYERDYTEFLEELEEDKLFRQNVNIYFSESVSLSLCIHTCVCHVQCVITFHKSYRSQGQNSTHPRS